MRVYACFVENLSHPLRFAREFDIATSRSELACGLGIDDNNLSEMEAELKLLRREHEGLRQKRDSLVQSPLCGEKGDEHCQPEPAMGDQIIETHREVGHIRAAYQSGRGLHLSLGYRRLLAFESAHLS